MRLVKYLLVIFIIWSCNSIDKSNKIENNSTIKQYFNQSEIKTLKYIVLAFENEILKNDSLDIISSYEILLSNLNIFIQNDDSIFFITDFNIKHEKIFDNIDTLMLNEIWSSGKGLHSHHYSDSQVEVDTTYELTFNFTGRYLKFLEEYANIDKSIKDYVDIFAVHGDIKCMWTPEAIQYFSNLNLNNEVIRLITVIQIINWLDTIYFSYYDE
ncbi:MAG: hypothetical protein JXJ22_04315 [Bacteroidales bacterium]|nr:hypothetical protein [Bacteroidales bacterium]